MNRIPVISSNLAEVGYQPENHTLEILFHSGYLYQYDGVPMHIYSGLMNAESKGRYFDQFVRYAFPTRRLN